MSDQSAVVPRAMLTPKEAADALGLSVRTIRKLFLAGTLRGMRTGGESGHFRISRASIEALGAKIE